MSKARYSLSFADYENELENTFLKSGKARWAKEAMKFFLKYEPIIHRMILLPDNFNPIASNNNIETPIKLDETQRKKVNKAFK